MNIMTNETPEIKCENPYFSHIWKGDKTFELRKNDRDYREGQVIRLCEYNATNCSYSGRSILIFIKYLLPGGNYGLSKDSCIFGFEILQRLSINTHILHITLDRDTCEWISERARIRGKTAEEVAAESIRDYRDIAAYHQNMRESDHR